jgi:type IV pilus assembly protein PilX
MINYPTAFPKSQHGAVLIIALLLLVMIMMLGIPAVTTNMLNERMSGNTRQRDLAFQAAEHALQEADAFMSTQTAAALDLQFDPNSDSNCADHANGFLCNGESHDNDAAYWRNTFAWGTASNYRTPTNALATGLVASQPRYVVEKMPDVTDGTPPTTKKYYRITARGLGQDSDAIVILQAMYQY